MIFFRIALFRIFSGATPHQRRQNFNVASFSGLSNALFKIFRLFFSPDRFEKNIRAHREHDSEKLPESSKSLFQSSPGLSPVKHYRFVVTLLYTSITICQISFAKKSQKSLYPRSIHAQIKPKTCFTSSGVMRSRHAFVPRGQSRLKQGEQGNLSYSIVHFCDSGAVAAGRGRATE